MPSFGEKLRREREARDKTIEEISASTGIGQSYLEALENDEFEELPGRAFGKLYIRAYAKVLEFDPGPLLVDYDREQQNRRANEPPGGLPPKPIMVRPEMPATLPDEEPPEPEPEEPDGALPDTPVEVREEVLDEAPIEIPIEAVPNDAPGEAASEEPAQVPAEESVEAAEEDSPPPPLEEPDRIEPEIPQETERVPAGAQRPARIEIASPAFEGNVTARDGAPARSRTALMAALIGVPLLIVIVWILFGLLGGEDADSEPGAAVATLDDASEREMPPTSSAPPPEPSEAPADDDVQPEAVEEPTKSTDESPAVGAGAASGVLVVDEYGVGRRVVNHRLEERDDRFQAGEVVWFLTRVQGGRRGERIRHVWLYEGSPVQSIDLVIGGPHWRTQSNKTLWEVGSWTVEARDREDRVLARAAFTCVPR